MSNYSVLSPSVARYVGELYRSQTLHSDTYPGVQDNEAICTNWIKCTADLTTYAGDGVTIVPTNGYSGYIYSGVSTYWDSVNKVWVDQTGNVLLIDANENALTVNNRYFSAMAGWDGTPSSGSQVGGYPVNGSGNRVAPVWVVIGGNIGCYPVVVITGVSCSADGGLDVQTTTIGSCSPYTYGT